MRKLLACIATAVATVVAVASCSDSMSPAAAASFCAAAAEAGTFNDSGIDYADDKVLASIAAGVEKLANQAPSEIKDDSEAIRTVVTDAVQAARAAGPAAAARSTAYTLTVFRGLRRLAPAALDLSRYLGQHCDTNAFGDFGSVGSASSDQVKSLESSMSAIDDLNRIASQLNELTDISQLSDLIGLTDLSG